MNRAIQQVQKEIDLFGEYRARLIANVDTGKLDLTGLEMPGEAGRSDEPDAIEEDEAEQHLVADWLPGGDDE